MIARFLMAVLILLPAAVALPAPHGLGPLAPPPPGAGSGTNAPSAADYGLSFRCVPLSEPSSPAETALACPSYVLDVEDLLAQPALILDPNNPDWVAFHALHGGHGVHPTQPPPSNRSRSNELHQPHTTFQSADRGANWADNRYYAPSAIDRPGRTVFGEDNAAVVDGAGNVHLASLYSYRSGAAAANRYAVALWKSGPINQIIDYLVGLQVVELEGRADTLQLGYAPSSGLVAAVWRETAPPAAARGAPGPASIMITSSEAGRGKPWSAPQPWVHACRASSNVIGLGDQFLVACQADAGYDQGPAPAPGRWYLHGYALRSLHQQHLGPLPFERGRVTLVAADGGRLAAVAAGIGAKGRPFLDVAYASDARNWSQPTSLIDEVRPDGESRRPIDVRVLAGAYLRRSGNLHLVYMERYESILGASAPEQRDLFKSLVSVRYGAEVQGAASLQMGSPATRVGVHPTYMGTSPDLFLDLHDSIVSWGPTAAEEKEFIAYGDHGYVRFAEVVEADFLPPPAPPLSEVGALPAATSSTSADVAGVAAGLIASAMVLRLLMTRRRLHAEAPTLG